MKCPICGSASSVLETRERQGSVSNRKRKCATGHKFNTYEFYISSGLTLKAMRLIREILEGKE